METKSDGKQLEHFVKKFHEVFSDENTTIEPNKKLYNKKGVCIGEIDVLITDRISSVPIQIAIECRARPSEGKQGRRWIQQIIGRIKDFQYEKNIAVSTTGFTEPAIELAKENKILLRTVSDCSDIIDDFSLCGFSFNYPMFKLNGKFRVSVGDKTLNNSECTNALFKTSKDATYKRVDYFAIEHLPSYIDKESRSWQNVDIIIPNNLYMKTKNKEYRVKNFRANGIYSNVELRAKCIGIKTFNEDNKCIGQQVRVFPPYPVDSWIDMLFIRKNAEVYTLNFLDAYFPPEDKDIVIISKGFQKED
jgi:Restriction endonuclease